MIRGLSIALSGAFLLVTVVGSLAPAAEAAGEGGMAKMAPESQATPSSQAEPFEHGTKQADGLAVALLSAPPLSPAEIERTMPGMGGMRGMQEMGRMRGMAGRQEMPGVGGMGGEAATHWIGVIVRSLAENRVAQDLDITLTAKKGEVVRTMKLMPMPGSYGANVSLPEKGRYVVTVAIARPRQPLSVSFDFSYE